MTLAQLQVRCGSTQFIPRAETQSADTLKPDVDTGLQQSKSKCKASTEATTAVREAAQPAHGTQPRASRRVASCKMSVSTLPGGSCTYRTTEPRMKQLRTDNCTAGGVSVQCCTSI